MSIRSTKFANEIIPLWKEIESLLKDINVKGLSTDDRNEIAHSKKVVAYFSGMLDAIDPDFIPMQVLVNVISPITYIKSNLVSYINSSNISYIKDINNNYLDTLLRDLMPFIFYKGNAGRVLTTALEQYAEAMTEHSKHYLEELQEYSERNKNITRDAENILSDLSEKQEKFENYNNELFENDGLESKIAGLAADFESKHKEIDKLYQSTFDKDGLKNELYSYLNDAKEESYKIKDLKKTSSQVLRELEEFHEEIFGTENEDGEKEGGLKNELETRKQELDDFKKKQQERYNELNKQIESLLPGATSAGLSNAYNAMRKKFSKDVASYGKWFYWALAILFIVIVSVNINFGSLLNYISSIFRKTEIITQIEQHNNDSSIGITLISILKGLIYKLPFILPAFWLVMFVSKRRSEAQRLEQEYAHKEALAKSYESYKKQIEKLNEEEQSKLLPILMENMLKAIALNPADTLDKNHKEPTPIEEIVKKKEILEFIEKLKEIVTSKP